MNQFQVRPNQLTLESEYFQRNIDATKDAYGLDGLEKSDFKAVTDAEPGELRADAETTASIRIMDPAIISPTVRQLEQYRSVLPLHRPARRRPLPDRRRRVAGCRRVGARAQPRPAGRRRALVENTTLVYTHGYGMVAAEGNARTTDGNPVFFERGIQRRARSRAPRAARAARTSASTR